MQQCRWHTQASSQTSTNTSSYGTLEFNFYNNTLPTYSGNYTVVSNYPIAGGQIIISEVVGPGTSTPVNYNPTRNNQKVQILVTSSGKVSISGSNIEMGNVANPADSGSLTLDIHQLN